MEMEILDNIKVSIEGCCCHHSSLIDLAPDVYIRPSLHQPSDLLVITIHGSPVEIGHDKIIVQRYDDTVGARLIGR